MKKLLLIATMLIYSTVYSQDTSQVAATVDKLIEKYSPDVKAGFEKMYDFTKVKGEQALEIFYRYLLIKDIFWLSFMVIFQIVVFVIHFWFLRLHKADDYSDWNIGAYMVLGIGSVIGIIGICVNAYDLVLLITVPEIRLLQELLALIKYS